MDEFAAGTEFSDATLDAMVREVRPDWSLREATPAAEGTDAVYFVDVETPVGSRECVLKACTFLDPAEFRPEPHLLTAVGRRTALPVPGVLGAVDDHADLPAPFFLTERCDGEVRENGARDLSVATLERLAREAGRFLGELHAVGDFRTFGPVRLVRDVDREPPSESSGVSVPGTTDTPTAETGGVAGTDRRLVAGDDAADAWRDHVESFARATFDGVADRFTGPAADLRPVVDERMDALDPAFDPVLGHDDYRLGNLLVDADAGRTKVVLDWGNANTMEAQYNLVLAEQYLSGWASHDGDRRRERVRAALREGYAATNHLERDADFERRRELYLAVTRLFPLAWFQLWYGDEPAAERERAAERHRRAVRELVA